MKRIALVGIAAVSVAFFAQADMPTNTKTSGAAASGFGGDEYSAVDPFWGCGGTQAPKAEGMAYGWSWTKAQTGNTHPGALLPFGWVSVCAYTGGYPSGYGRFGVSSSGPAPEKLKRMEGFGFTHFHQSGTGWCDRFYNLFLFSPYAPGADLGRASRLTDETARPGLYSASMPDYGSAFELTARRYAACHRYRFPGGRGALRINTRAAGFRRDLFGGRASYREDVNGKEMSSSANGWRGCINVYGLDIWFDFRVVKGAVVSSSEKDGVIDIAFGGGEAETAIGFSLVRPEEAAARAEEAARVGFDRTCAEAAAEWAKRLGRVRAQFAEPALRSRFYSALYHSFVKPVDAGGRYLDFMTMWDTYRTQLPLLLSVEPDVGEAVIDSLLRDSERNGFIANWNTMQARLSRSDVQATALGVFTLADGFFRGAVGKRDYPRLKAAFAREFEGYDLSDKSFAHTLDLAGAYRAAAFVADACGDEAYARELKGKCGIWRKVFDPATGCLANTVTYYEGDCHTYSFRPLPGMAARVALAGGLKAFNEMLDSFFAVGFVPKPGERERIFRSGRFEGFNNESDIDAPFSYIWCGRADRFAEVCDSGRRYRFTDGEGALPGNNDSGGLSAWYVWSCLGLHPVTGTPYYVLGSPSVDSAELDFRGGTLRIRVERESARAIYPKGYSFGGRDFREPWISVRELEKGGELVFRLADHPDAASPLPDWY